MAVPRAPLAPVIRIVLGVFGMVDRDVGDAPGAVLREQARELGYLKAMVYFAMKRPDLADAFEVGTDAIFTLK